MRITPTIAGLLVLSGTIGVSSLVPQWTALRAAEGGEAVASSAAVSIEAADQTGLQKDATIKKNSPADGSKQRVALSKLESCKSQFKLADLNGDGVLDQTEIAHYDSSIRSEGQPLLPDGDRLNEAGFIAACSAVSAHE
jgi:hypothetical protein